MKLTSTYALISHPVDHKDLWTKRCLIWETGEPYIYVRTCNNRIIIGGEDEEFCDPEARDELLRKKQRYLRRKSIIYCLQYLSKQKWLGVELLVLRKTDFRSSGHGPGCNTYF